LNVENFKSAANLTQCVKPPACINFNSLELLSLSYDVLAYACSRWLFGVSSRWLIGIISGVKFSQNPTWDHGSLYAKTIRMQLSSHKLFSLCLYSTISYSLGHCAQASIGFGTHLWWIGSSGFIFTQLSINITLSFETLIQEFY
jgi:hypothetical protein